MIPHFTGQFIKRGGKLVFVNATNENRYNRFRQHINEGSKVDVFMEFLADDATLGQLAKVHSLIRTLAGHTGDSFDDMKVKVKIKAGLYISREIEGREYYELKSFGKCSFDELSLAIQSTIEIGEQVNLLLS